MKTLSILALAASLSFAAPQGRKGLAKDLGLNENQKTQV